jgi:hypothetical protein
MNDYAKKLLTDDWTITRELIAIRDNYKCTYPKCNRKGTEFYLLPLNECQTDEIKKYDIYIKHYNGNIIYRRKLLNNEYRFVEIKIKLFKTIINCNGQMVEIFTIPYDLFINNPENSIFFKTVLNLIRENSYENIEMETYPLNIKESYFKLNNLFLFGRMKSNYTSEMISKTIKRIYYGDDLKNINNEIFDFVIPNIENGLNIHHKLYRSNSEPWDYSIDELQTLCNKCHSIVHKNEIIPVFDENNRRLNINWCPKCNGTGYIQEFSYYYEGICFDCNGKRYTIKN